MSEATLPVGAQVAGYRIAGTLGRGGMGFVYEAEHAVLGRKAALKTLLPELLEDGDFRQRFVAESQTVAALDHPSIIPIYDAGDADGIVYIAMRYVAGGDLAQLIDTGTLEMERALDILEQVAGALDAAHANELVHRDVKPANVLVESGGRVYLTDFGIAKRARTKGVTQTGFFVGTLDYAAPEQIRGESVGAPADVYAFGCLVFECLTGKKPFERETDVAVMYAQLRDDPPSVHELRPELPASIDAALARALAKEEDGRYATCRELVEAIRSCLGGVMPSTTTPPRPAAVVESTVTNLPIPPTTLIGRDLELAALVELAGREDVRLVTLTGTGGTGKTRLAIAVSAELAPTLGSVFFVDLAPVAEASVVGSAIGQVLGVEESSDLSPAESIARGLGEGSALLVLDNFEQVMEANDLVHELLAAAPALTVLVTSQAPLHLRDEHEYPLDPLGEEQAVKLFLARAQAVKPGFELKNENSEAVHAICRRLDGLPLALELAAARVKLLSPDAILRRLEDSLDLLTGGASDLPTRQRTLRDAIDWSFQLLEPAEQALFARLGVFAGGCSLELADAVAGEAAGVGDALDTLASLVDKSLVRQRDGADGEPRFVLLETIREYALEQLEERGELEDLRRRHAERFLASVEAAEPELLRTNQAVWLERLDADRDNIRAALAWATATGEIELALRMAGALVRFWSTRGLMREGRARLAEALAGPDAVSPAILAKAYFAAGYAALGEGDFREARADFERSLEQARAASDGQAEGAALAQIAWVAMAGGEAEEARSLAEQASALAEQAGDNLVASGAATTLADVALAEGKLDDAIELFERGLTLRRGLGDRRLIANSLVGLGRAYLLRGDYDQAAALFEEALGLAREVKDTWIISVALGHLARERLLAAGDTAKARELITEALRLARDRNDRRLAAEWVQTLAVACALEGSRPDAVRFAASAATLCETTGALPYPAEELLQERFLTEVRADSGFAAALGAARAQPSEELVAEAAEAAAQRRSSETITSPGT